MAHPSWGPGWPNCQTKHVITVVIHRDDKMHELRLPVRREIAPLVVGLVRDLEKAQDRKFHIGWCWGGACRAISGTSTPSNHSYYLAIDLNAPNNPYMTAAAHRLPHPLRKHFNNGKLLRSDMPKDASAIARRWGFRWGGDYTTKPDPMHYEFMGSVQEALDRVHRLEVRERRHERRAA